MRLFDRNALMKCNLQFTGGNEHVAISTRRGGISCITTVAPPTSSTTGRMVAVMLLVSTLLGCDGKSEKAETKGGAAKLPEVGFVQIHPTSTDLTIELPGRVSAFQASEVRPQVDGIVRKRLFTEGSIVERGQTLYEIDTRIYAANVREARADLSSAQASERTARALLDRYKPLIQAQLIAKQDYADALARSEQASALVEQSRARLETAEVNLQFARVPAPITGRVGRSLVTEGALVTSSQPAPLAVIQRLDPVFVDVQQSSADMLALRRSLAQQGMASGDAKVQLLLEDGTSYAMGGTLQFSETIVDQATGTVTLRAQFANPDDVLLPGMFVRAKFAQAISTRAFLVPQQALQRDIKGDANVYVIDDANKAQLRPVRALQALGDAWVVTEGLMPGERVITQGLDNIRNDMPVNPVRASTQEQVGPSPGNRSSSAKARD